MISHGYKVQDGHDAYVEVVNDAMDKFTVATATGAFFVDFMPILRYIPKWFPGAMFQRKAAAWRERLTDMAEIPFEFVKVQMVSRSFFLFRRNRPQSWKRGLEPTSPTWFRDC